MKQLFAKDTICYVGDVKYQKITKGAWA